MRPDRIDRQRVVRSRALVRNLSRQALEEAGERLAVAQQRADHEFELIAQHIAGAIGVGLSISEIARLTGLSRPKVYELRDRYRPADGELEMRVLAQLAASGGLSTEQLADQLDESLARLREAIEALEARTHVRLALTYYDASDPTELYRIAPDAYPTLERWILRTGEEPQQMSVYVVLDPTEQEAIREAAIQVLGPELFAVIEPGTVGDQDGPELGFSLAAGDFDEAVARAGERMRELRAVAGLEPKPVLIKAVLEGRPGYLATAVRRRLRS
jgi:DNA-binding phage protein